MTEGIKEKKICGAKTKRREGVCNRGPSPGKKRCYIHGGTNPGAPKGSQNARTHGASTLNFTDEERKLAESRPIEDLRPEIYGLRVQIARLFEYDNKIKEDYGLSLLREEVATEGVTEDGYNKTTKIIKQVKDHSSLLERKLARLEKLTALHLNIAGTKGDEMSDVLDKISSSLEELR